MKAADKKAKERYLKKLKLVRSQKISNPYETDEERADAIQRAKDDVVECVKRYFPHYATSECAEFQAEWAEMVDADPTFTGFAKWFRGAAKSVWNNVIIPFWQWLRHGDNYIVIIGVNEKKAIQLLEDLRAEFEGNPQIIADFGEQKNLGSWKEDLWVIKDGTFIGQALGFGEECRGLRVGARRPKYYNIDDLETRKTIKNEKRQGEMVDWVENDLLPSMDGDNERLLISNNWWAETMFIKKLYEKHPDWVVHEVKAYDKNTYEPTWHSKYTAEYYRKKEKRMGILSAHAEYLHEPTPKGKIFTPSQIIWDKRPNLNHFKIIVGHWDIAYAGTETSDYNAVRVWGLYRDEFWYIKSFVRQTKMRAALLWMSYVQKTLPPTVKIHWQYEGQFWNDEVQRTINEVQKETGVKLNLYRISTPRVKKYDRMMGMQPYYQNGRPHYDKRMKNDPDTQTGLKQLYGIEPNYTTKDDAPDADEQCFQKMEAHLDVGKNTAKPQTGRMQPNNERI